MIKWLKKHHILHSWGRFGESVVIKTYLTLDKTDYLNLRYQSRYCEKCGKMQWKMV